MSAISFDTMLVDERLAHLTVTIDLDDEALEEMGPVSEEMALIISLQHLYCVAKLNWPDGVIDTLLYNVWKEAHDTASTEQKANGNGRELLLRGDKG